MMMQYFMTNDVTIHVNCLKVAFNALKFTEEEQIKVKEAFNANNLSYMGRMAGTKLI